MILFPIVCDKGINLIVFSSFSRAILADHSVMMKCYQIVAIITLGFIKFSATTQCVISKLIFFSILIGLLECCGGTCVKIEALKNSFLLHFAHSRRNSLAVIKN
jgi:hypothetical protein